MLDPNSAARNLEIDPMEWTGRMEFELSDPRGWQIGMVEIDRGKNSAAVSFDADRDRDACRPTDDRELQRGIAGDLANW